MTLGFYATSIILVLVIIPFTSYFYEGEDNDDDPEGGNRSSAAQLGYAIKWTIPTLCVFAGIIAAMYFGGLATAEIPATYLQSPLFETTDLEANSLDSYFTFQFYCNTTTLGVPITLIPNKPIALNQSAPVYVPTPVLGTNQPKLGCENLAGKPVIDIHIDLL